MGSDEEYLDNLLKSLADDDTAMETDGDLDSLLSRLDEELDDQLQQEENTENTISNQTGFDAGDAASDFGIDAAGENLNFGSDIDSGSMETDDMEDFEDLFGSLAGQTDETGMAGDSAALSEDDAELAEINELLRKSDDNELIDDDMLALLESMSEEDTESAGEESDTDISSLLGVDLGLGDAAPASEAADEEAAAEKPAKAKKAKREKKVKEKKVREKRKRKEAAEGDGSGTVKGKGLFARFWEAMTEEVEEEDAQDENQTILKELEQEDAENQKSKKKKKEKKPKKEKPPKEKKVKEKKVKPKKEKKVKEEKEPEKKKKLPLSMVLSVIAFGGTILVGLLIASMIIPGISIENTIKEAYRDRDYATIYYTLAGEKQTKEEQRVFEQAKLLMQLQRKVDSYHNYISMEMEEEALNALLRGVQKYNDMRLLAEEYEVADAFEQEYNEILNILSEGYGITEEDAIEINSLGDAAYRERVAELTGNGR